jgi:KaiC/GvpD/RAD55 family RecA-like ATPase
MSSRGLSHTENLIQASPATGVQEIAEAARRGMTLIYGPPGSGKTSLAMKLADKVASRVLWVSTVEGPELLREAARRLAVDAGKFDFYDFPRAFGRDIALFVLERAKDHDAVVVDSISGMAPRREIGTLAHSVLYQLAREKPVILIAERKTPGVAYIADNVVRVWYRRTSVGHIVRFAQLEKSRALPPGPRYIFEILEGRGIMYLEFTKAIGRAEIIRDERLGVETARHSVICVFSGSARKLADFLARVHDDALFVQIGHWTAFHGLNISEERVRVIATFHDFFRLAADLVSEKVKPRYIIAGGLANLRERELPVYMLALHGYTGYVDYLVLADAATDKARVFTPFCDETITL